MSSQALHGEPLCVCVCVCIVVFGELTCDIFWILRLECFDTGVSTHTHTSSMTLIPACLQGTRSKTLHFSNEIKGKSRRKVDLTKSIFSACACACRRTNQQFAPYPTARTARAVARVRSVAWCISNNRSPKRWMVLYFLPTIYSTARRSMLNISNSTACIIGVRNSFSREKCIYFTIPWEQS